ncbi:MAG: thermonuclease family protein [Pseudanabaenaceae cyanobacterium SKYGB_i_bin29]|nr:thermonuclease family protein [Pseudanabaenaceae cyanobacterium SKYG29]MDW8421315.1 thermonuclease family protein [Pseudanabaenaceae cyanobacterium SKYGB_i_bin29]
MLTDSVLTRRLVFLAGGLLLCGGTNIALDVLGKPKPQNQESWQAKRIISGQTIEAVPVGSNQRKRIRLIGISAPALDQDPWGLAARSRLEELVGGDPFLLEKDAEEIDDSNRLLGYIWADGRLVNLILVEEGYVLADVRPPNNRYQKLLENAQARARILGLGIWDPRNPLRLTPSEHFRLKQQGGKSLT